MAIEDETATETTGRNTNTPPDTIAYGAHELGRLEAEHAEAKAEASKAGKAVRACRKRLESYGIDMAAFDLARADLAAGADAVRATMVKRGEYLRAMKSDLGHQFDLFAEPSRETQDSRWRFEGYHAYLSGQDASECPHRPGDAGQKPWMDGYMDAAKVVAAGMARVTTVEEDEGDEDDPVTPANDVAEVPDAEFAEAEGDFSGVEELAEAEPFDDVDTPAMHP